MTRQKILSRIRPILTTLMPLLWLGHIGLGMIYGFMGPSQPYLAK